MDIKKGYNVVVRSWENDWDAHSTQIVNCETVEEAKFLANLARKFTSGSRGKVEYTPGVDIDTVMGYGNDGIDGDTLKELISAVFEKYGKEEFRKSYEMALDDYRGDDFDSIAVDLTRDLLGTPASDIYLFDYTNFCRVCESVEIFYIKESPVKIEF